MSIVLRPLVFAALAFGAVAAAAQRGVVQGVTVKPNPVAAGTAVTVTATGTNPCGAVFVDWGDGTAITYAIYSLPVSQTHAFGAGGRFTVVAKGMGNCDGEVKTTLDVKPPPSPPPPPPPPPEPTEKIARVDMRPSPARVRQPVDIVVAGNGPCAFTIDFGDGNTREESGALPRTVRHTYAVPDTYIVIVRPDPPCAGKFTQRLTVTDANVAAELSGVTVSPVRAVAGQAVTIDVTGKGACQYSIDFGDGNADSRSRDLPDRLRHTYPAPDRYTVSVAAEPPCLGSAHANLIVRPRR